MKFFSAALAAVAVGSAMAVPVLDARTTPTQDCTSCAPCSAGTVGPCHSLPAVAVDVNADVNADLDLDVTAVVTTVTKTVLDVKALVEADLKLIAELTAKVDVDVQALIKAIVDLKVHLSVLVKDCVPLLDGLIIDAHLLADAELKAVLALAADVQALLAEVEVCIKALVSLKAEVRAAIAAQIKLLVKVCLSIATPIINLALSIVARVQLDLPDLIAKLNATVGSLNLCLHGLSIDLGRIVGGVLN